MKYILVFLTAFCLLAVIGASSVWWSGTPDFVINETANFDAGFKANNSDGNFNIETYTDNLNIDEDTFELSNKYSDRFTYPHDFVADGNTWKWNYDSQLINDATWVTNEANININESGGFQIKQETDVSFADTYITTGLATGDIDFQTDFEWSSTGTDNAWLCFGFFDRPEVYDSTLFPICMYNEEGDMYFYAWSVTGADAFDVADDSYGKFRVSRTNTDTNEETFRFYFWDNVASDWELFLEDIVDSSVYEIADDDLYIGYFTETENTAGEALHNLDEFKVNSGTLGATTTNPYKETGNWTSDTITMTAGMMLSNLTLNFTSMDDDTYLDFINILDTSGNIIYNYAGDLHMSGGTMSLNTADFGTIDENFKLDIGLKGDGTGTPKLDDIIGYYEDIPEPYYSDHTKPVFATDSSIVYLLRGIATLDDFDGTGFNVLEKQTAYTTAYGYTAANYRTAQSFNRTSSYDLQGVTVALGLYYQYVPRDLNNGVTIRIETDSGSDTPSGSLANPLLVQHLTADEVIGGANSFTASGQSYNGQTTFVFNESVTIPAGTKLWFVVIPDTPVATYYYVQGYNTAGGYTGGTFRTSTNGGGTWAATVGDTMFFLLGNTMNTSSYTKSGKTLTLSKEYSFEVNGMSKLNLTAGDTFQRAQNNVAGAGTTILIGYTFGGGSLDAYGNATDHVTIKNQESGAPTYGNYVVRLYGGTAWGRWTDMIGKTNGATFYTYGVYSTSDFGNSMFQNTYSAAGSYSYYLYRSARETTFNNCTFWRNHATGGYNIYLYATTYHEALFIDSKIITNGAYAYAVYNGESLTSAPRFFSTTYNGNPLTKSHIANVYTGTTFVLGSSVNPTIIDSSGNPISGAIVTLTPQFISDDLNSTYQYGTDPRNYGAQTVYVFTSPSIMYGVTNSDGKAVNEYGTSRMWMWDIRYLGTTEKEWIYYSGTNLSLRTTNNYNWKNDGSDYGYLLTVTHPTLGSYTEVILANQTYNGTITLSGGTSGEDSINIIPIITAVLSFLFIFISRKLDGNNPMKILYFTLSLIFIIITLFSSSIMADLGGYTEIADVQISIMVLIVLVTVLVIGLFMIKWTSTLTKNMMGDKD